ncbi:dTDP-4-amino-4,6-dideoxygalactose transaminase [Desulfobacterales bacterium HSG16]|nr:dTDP-4-amino-4,6-dideoxygalactose transaminase [Desulfobacterales bacterium HSG16]
MNTPLNKPFIVGRELYNIAQAVTKHKQISGGGRFTYQCQEWLQNTLGSQKALLTHSCSGALEMAAILCNIQPGDEVIMPSYTFVSTANAFVLRGGVPVFIDIKPDTLNLDESLIESAMTEKTKAIVPVHYAGFPCEMDTVMQIATRYNVFVIEDAAQALLSEYNGKKLGTIGHLGTLSFHETKNIISGEGGALLINDAQFIDRAEIIWEKGTDRRKFQRGEVDKYTWIDVGSSYSPSETIAGFLRAQFEHADAIIEKRRSLWNVYFTLLQPLEEKKYISLPAKVHESKNNGHLFYIITASAAERTQLIEHLNQRGIASVFHYIPLHSSPAGCRYGRTAGSMEITNDLSLRVLRLPLYFEMTEHDVKEVVCAVHDFFRKNT